MTSTATTTSRVAREQLAAFIARIEKCEEEKKASSDDIKAIYAEAKAEGWDVKTLRSIVKLRRYTAEERAETFALLDTYQHALDMTKERPLYADVAALAGDDLGREHVIDVFKQLVPRGGEIICRVGGDPVRIYRTLDDLTVVEPYDEPKAAPPRERPGRTARKPGTVLHMVPGGKKGDPVKDAADRAEAMTREKAGEAGPDDELYRAAIALVTKEDGKASTSYVQRHLQIGYNRAAELMERMEREGIIGPADHAGKREVLSRGDERQLADALNGDDDKPTEG